MFCDSPSFHVHSMVNQHFGDLLGQAIRQKLWSTLTRRQRCLLNQYEIQKETKVQSRSHIGIQTVPIDKIRGSEGRCCDFDAQFRPLKRPCELRWTGIAMARHNEVALPAVDLVQIADLFFVRDGHHRISVAKVFGQREIEAAVTVWRCSGPVQTGAAGERCGYMGRVLARTGGWLAKLGAGLRASAGVQPVTST